MSQLPEITRKVVSYCSIPQDITDNHWVGTQTSCDSYVDYTLEAPGEDDLSDWLRMMHSELIGEQFFIHIDY